jgi:hypothetical protein
MPVHSQMNISYHSDYCPRGAIGFCQKQVVELAPISPQNSPKEELEKFIPDQHVFRLARVRELDFARMLAKIAHSYAYAKCGVEAFKPTLLDLILGKVENAPYWVGGHRGGPLLEQPNDMHGIYRRHMAPGLLQDPTGPHELAHAAEPEHVFAVTSLIPVIDRLRRRFNIARVCVVADRGMISAETLAELEARRLLYILGVRERTDKLVRACAR